MQVWNVLRATRWKCRTQKIAKKSPSAHHRTTLSGHIFATKAHIDNRKKNLLNSDIHVSSQYGELRPTSGWDLLASLGHPCKFQRVSRLSSVTARHSSSGRQPNFVALNRGCHLYSTGRSSRWALAHISSSVVISWGKLPVRFSAQVWMFSGVARIWCDGAQNYRNFLSQIKWREIMHWTKFMYSCDWTTAAAIAECSVWRGNRT